MFTFSLFVMHDCEQGQESDSSETSVRGPRIKHVCRRAAVALGRNRAVFPDDMPTLSALPWEEREKILSSMGNDGKAYLSFGLLISSNLWLCCQSLREKTDSLHLHM